mgnify:CR=1 FL=1
MVRRHLSFLLLITFLTASISFLKLFLFKEKTAYVVRLSVVGTEMCIREWECTLQL